MEWNGFFESLYYRVHGEPSYKPVLKLQDGVITNGNKLLEPFQCSFRCIFRCRSLPRIRCIFILTFYSFTRFQLFDMRIFVNGICFKVFQGRWSRRLFLKYIITWILFILFVSWNRNVYVLKSTIWNFLLPFHLFYFSFFSLNI